MEERSTIRVTNIQRMCFHDGPGIRTTVFLKGCSLHCPWCSNPENISFDIEEYYHDGQKGCYGTDYPPDLLYNELIKDRIFWGTNGGITFSGGEPLMHTENLVPLLTKLHNEEINIAVETSLFAPSKNVDAVVDLIDYFIVDVKVLDGELCKVILGGLLDNYYENIYKVYQKGRLKLFRLPLCYEYTFSDANKDRLLNFLLLYKDVSVQLFSIHSLGASKYISLGREQWTGRQVDAEDLDEFCDLLKQSGIDAEIIKM